MGDAGRVAPGSPSLVIQTSFLGDVVLTTPLLAHLAARGPVDVVTTPAGGGLLESHPAVRRVIRYDKRGAQQGLSGLRALARELKGARYGAAYLAQGSWRSAALAWMARVPVRIGFDTSSGRLLQTSTVTYRSDMHHAERLYRLAAGDAPGTVPAPSLMPSDEDHATVQSLLGAAPFGTAPFVVVAPGSVWATKRWPFHPSLVENLPPDVGIVVTGSADDRELAAAIVAAAPSRVLDATGRLGLLASAALIGRARAIVTNDSLPQHLASAMNTPTLTIYGPTLPAFGFGPLATRRTIVEHAPGLECRPCSAHGPMTCPRGHFRCMRDISAAAVGASIGPLLAD
ncbi:MAG TPA: lipopolysaccharide heptosyltransferase II [Gemmatimonadaceae bacterium]|nr:lipopolysaccharide heptosyltransferase II [Gemmatimonadaceae bacterium]